MVKIAPSPLPLADEAGPDGDGAPAADADEEDGAG
jgi:hypothetical protein